MPATLESFGVAVDFLSRFEPFASTGLGVFARAVRRQILNQEHVIAFDGENIVGYAGWLPTSTADAEAWVKDGGELRPVERGADAAALTTVAVSDPKVTLGLMRAARERNPGIRVVFKRSYTDETRKPRKAAVQNVTGMARPTGSTTATTEGLAPPPSRQTPAVSDATPRPVTRPPIADDPCAFLYALAERAPGRTERVAVGDTSVLVVQDPQIASHVLVGNLANYTKNFASFTPFFGRSRLTLDGEPWRRSQRISQSFIAPHDSARATEIVGRIYAALADELLAGGGTARPIDPQIDRAAVAALTEIAFSIPLAELGDDFAADLRPIIRYASLRAWDLPGVPSILDEGTLAAAQAATARIRTAINRAVARRRTEPPRSDALSALIAAADRRVEGPEETQIDLPGELLTLVVAGSDTTSAALGWALSILAAAPPFQDALRAEMVAACARRAPTLDDIDAIPSLRPFIDETLRMFPPVAILSRFAQADDTIDGHAVAPGDRVLVSVIGLHQNPESWEAPREFRPDRFDPDATGRAERRARFMAFSAGPRICGGARFAQIEMAVALIQVLRRCRLEATDPLPFAFDWGASMRRRGGQKIRVTAL
jgi:cytochrome P450